MRYLFNGNNGCTKAPQYYAIFTLPVFISMYKIPLIIILALALFCVESTPKSKRHLNINCV